VGAHVRPNMLNMPKSASADGQCRRLGIQHSIMYCGVLLCAADSSEQLRRVCIRERRRRGLLIFFSHGLDWYNKTDNHVRIA